MTNYDPWTAETTAFDPQHVNDEQQQQPDNPPRFDYKALALEMLVVAPGAGIIAGLLLALVDNALALAVDTGYTLSTYVVVGAMVMLTVALGALVYLIFDQVISRPNFANTWKAAWVIIPALGCSLLVLVSLRVPGQVWGALVVAVIWGAGAFFTYRVVPSRVEDRRLCGW